MFMKIKKIAVVVTITLSTLSLGSAANTKFSDKNSDTSVVSIDSNNNIVATGALATYATSIMTSVINSVAKKGVSALVSSIFGGGGSDVVTLSQQSLDDIEKIVNRQLDYMVRDDAMADFRSVSDGVEQYHYSAEAGIYDLGMLSSLETESRGLMNHQVFESGFADYAYLTGVYTNIAAFRYSITAERYLQGLTSVSAVKADAQKLLDKLTAMGKATDILIDNNVYMESKTTSQCTVLLLPNNQQSKQTIEEDQSITSAARCSDFYVYDKLESKTYVYRYNLYGAAGYNTAKWKLDSLRSQYVSSFKGGADFSNLLTQLSSAAAAN